jgi:uncharacterized RDD family membrane protein YckC
MKCPKCHYLSFEPEPRCKHCGYDLSIADADLAVAPVDTTSAPLDLRLRGDVDPPLPAPVRPAAPARSSYAAASVNMPLRPSPSAVALADPPPPAPRPAMPRVEARAPKPVAPVTTELPLFMKDLASADHVVEPSAPAPAPMARMADPAPEPLAPQAFVDEPVDVPIAPPPLAVRRAAPDTGAQRARVKAERSRKLGPFDRDLLEDLQRIEAEAARRARPADESPASIPAVDFHRLGAAAIDAAVLGGIGVAGFWFTLRWCDLTFGQAGVLPVAPLVAFFVLIALGYLLMFTAAGGQTIGKMVMGLRVVGDLPDDAADRPSLRQACYRALFTVPSVFALGLGFLPGLFGQGLAVHDRLAHTRVVRA